MLDDIPEKNAVSWIELRAHCLGRPLPRRARSLRRDTRLQLRSLRLPTPAWPWLPCAPRTPAWSHDGARCTRSAPSSASSRHLTLPACLRRHILRVQRRWGQRSASQSSVLTPLPRQHAHPVLHVQAAMSVALCVKLCVDASPYVANTLTTFYMRSRNVGGALATVRHAPTCRLAAVGRPYKGSSQCFVARHHQLMHNQTNIYRPGSLYMCSL
jgi:hypothetical protein